MAAVVGFVLGLLVGGGGVWLVLARRSEASGIAVLLGEMKNQQDMTAGQVDRLSAMFSHAGQRGRAGEIALENLLEAAGLGEHRDYKTQVVAADGSRPDVILDVPGRGKLPIDSKFPLDDYVRAATARDDPERQAALAAHAAAVARYVADLARRDYPSKLPGALDFTVCYVPGDGLLDAAYSQRPSLFYEALQDRVLIATPATMMALLWGVMYGLQRDARVERADEISILGAELHSRVGVMAGHMQKLGKTLDNAVEQFNNLVGSVEGRLIPKAREFEKLTLMPADKKLPDLNSAGLLAREIAPARWPAISGDDNAE
ncbi:MAG: DNA recombination protein RmuC [Actinobacteria bacterium]|nr:DNA recombination protein RmuC [Actinomycetota bacterium]